MKRYDLIVIGSGSGLDIAEAVAEKYKWKVALIEKGPLGGTCLNRGCIPSKILIHSAEVVQTINDSYKFGINSRINSIDFNRIIGRASKYVDSHARKIKESILLDHRIDLYQGQAEFVGHKRLWVNDKEIEGEKIVIAAGSRPKIPLIEELDKVSYITSAEALRLKRLPKSMIIIGGGYISAELGNFYSQFGCEVSIIQKGENLIDREDIDISSTFTRLFSKRINLFVKTTTKSVVQKSNGLKMVNMSDSFGNEKTIEAEELLIAVGMKPNTDLLKLEKTLVKTNQRGHVEVDECMETSEENVWAIGDIVGKAPFKHGANWEAKHVFWNLKGSKKYAVDYSAMPHAIFSHPQIASVGFTEQEAKAKNLNYEIRCYEYKDTGMGKAMEENNGFVKFIVADGRVMGCHILGPEASILIQEVVMLMKLNHGSIAKMKEVIHIHPALSELISKAL